MRMGPACPVTLQGVTGPQEGTVCDSDWDSVSRRGELLWLEASGSDMVGPDLRTQKEGMTVS